MASGKQSKRKRQEMRAQTVKTPPAVRAKGVGPARPSGKVLAVAGGVLAVIAVAVVLAVVLTGGKSSTTQNVPAVGSLATGLPGAAEVHSMFQGIPQHGDVLGSPSAPVTMVEYVDLQCPYCHEFETSSLPTLLKDYIRTGKVKLESRPIAFIGADSITGRKAVLAAAEQNHMFDAMQLLYFNQGVENTGWLSKDMVANVAASIPGLKVPEMLSAMNDSQVAAQAKKNDAAATADKVTATPTILVGKSGGKLSQVQLASPTDTASIIAAINAAS